MDQPHPGTAHEALEMLVGHWLGTTELAASPWGPAVASPFPGKES